MRRRPSRWRSNPVKKKNTKILFLIVKLQDLTEVGARTSIQQGASHLRDQRPPTSRRHQTYGIKDLQPAEGITQLGARTSNQLGGVKQASARTPSHQWASHKWVQVPSTSRKYHTSGGNNPQPEQGIMQVGAKTSNHQRASHNWGKYLQPVQDIKQVGGNNPNQYNTSHKFVQGPPTSRGHYAKWVQGYLIFAEVSAMTFNQQRTSYK